MMTDNSSARFFRLRHRRYALLKRFHLGVASAYEPPKSQTD